MQLILLQNVQNLGKLGDKVDVKPGYGRNFLVPQGKATPATEANLAEFEARGFRLIQQQATLQLETLLHRDRMFLGAKLAADWRVLHFLHHREAVCIARNLQLDEDVFTGCVAEHVGDIATRYLKWLRLVLRTVNDGGDRAGLLEFADRGTADGSAPLCCESYLLSHKGI